jgi:phosphosulfolactate phosphohydrolase-like enzyme
LTVFSAFVFLKSSIKFYAIDDTAGREAIIKIVEKHSNNWDMKFVENDVITAAAFYLEPTSVTTEKRVLIRELIADFKQALGEV